MLVPRRKRINYQRSKRLGVVEASLYLALFAPLCGPLARCHLKSYLLLLKPLLFLSRRRRMPPYISARSSFLMSFIASELVVVNQTSSFMNYLSARVYVDGLFSLIFLVKRSLAAVTLVGLWNDIYDA